MDNKISAKHKQSNRMKDIYLSANILHKLILTKIDDKYVFLLDELTQEQRDYINRRWCNGR